MCNHFYDFTVSILVNVTLFRHYPIFDINRCHGVTKYYNVTNLPSSTRNRFFDCNCSLQSLSGVKTKLPGHTIKTSQLQQRLSRCTNHVLLFFFLFLLFPLLLIICLRNVDRFLMLTLFGDY